MSGAGRSMGGVCSHYCTSLKLNFAPLPITKRKKKVRMSERKKRNLFPCTPSRLFPIIFQSIWYTTFSYFATFLFRVSSINSKPNIKRFSSFLCSFFYFFSSYFIFFSISINNFRFWWKQRQHIWITRRSWKHFSASTALCAFTIFAFGWELLWIINSWAVTTSGSNGLTTFSFQCLTVSKVAIAAHLAVCKYRQTWRQVFIFIATELHTLQLTNAFVSQSSDFKTNKTADGKNSCLKSASESCRFSFCYRLAFSFIVQLMHKRIF